MESQKVVLLGARVDSGLERVARIKAAQMGISKSELIRRAVVDFLIQVEREIEPATLAGAEVVGNG